MARGMCDDCFWQIQCQYSVEHPEEWVGECYDDDGGPRGMGGRVL